MSRIGPLNTWFFPIPSLWIDGVIITAPEEAIEVYRELRDRWLYKPLPESKEIPSVSLYPGKQEGKDGYFVRTEIMYR